MSNFSFTNRTNEEQEKITEFLIIGIPVTTLILNVPALVMIFWIIVLKEKVNNFHLLSIGITDALVGTSAYLMAETYLYTDELFTYYDCWARYYMYCISFDASMLHLLGICAQRLKIVQRKTAVQTPQDHRKFAWVVILASWTLSLIINSIPFIIWTKHHDLTICSLETLFSGYERMIFLYFGTVCAIITLLVVITMSILSRLLWVLGERHHTNAWGYKDRRLFVTVCIMAVLFFVTTSPLACVLLSYDFLGDNKRSHRSACILISLLNSAINPIVYLYRVQEFRNILKKIVFCGKFSNTVNHQSRENKTNEPNLAASSL
ncbi:ADORA1 [Mytilus edulis]|uniref:ADORA1 n=1 Tax=Mytilus edulis TaxID=6550 RepID=A0A8S3QNP7_MYTED|nr:ADORA1 [Mytilus edulis]